MKYYTVTIIVRDDGREEESDPEGSHYLQRNVLESRLRDLRIPLAGVDSRVVSVVEFDRVTTFGGNESGGQTKTGVLVSQGEPRVVGVEGIVHRARQRERRVSEESAVDKLTGLQNQDQWVMARPRIDSDPALWVLRVDVDRFKEINDTHGHAAGDSHLQLVAQIIHQASSFERISARGRFRSGGDEFTVVGNYNALVGAGEYIRHRVNNSLGRGPGTVSIGLGNTDETADSDMYTNKGRNKCLV